MVTVSVIAGSVDVGLIVWTPAPGIWKSIKSAPGAALAPRIAWRREPAPLSSVLITVKVAGARRSSRTSNPSGLRHVARPARRARRDVSLRSQRDHRENDMERLQAWLARFCFTHRSALAYN